MLNRRSRIDDPLWYKDAIIYEVRIRSFYDSNGDGIGDFPGITQKLDYLKDLGVDTLWLLPFYPSPLRDDGYDISDYYNIHPDYGTLSDFKTFLNEAHNRGLNIITELVLNHTSDQHAWFQRARQAKPDTDWRNFYVWNDNPEKYKEARIIFKDFERSNWTWDSVAGAFYWHRFYSHQPDLNYDNPTVIEEVFKVVDFWLEMGVDGMRLDTIPYIIEREGTSCENLPETHEFVKKLRHHIDSKFSNRMLLAEANQWPTDSVAYFGNGDECHMAFHFPIMPRLFMSIQLEDRFPLIDIIQQTPPIPDNAQWALFLRNHDELTLEMVTDQERDYMYRAYAQDPQARLNLGIRRRLAPLLGNDRRQIELMNGVLFSFPGTPVIYYADEIGMGDNIYLGDRDGVRTPMQWNADRNAGFSKASSQRLCLPITMEPEYHYETVNVETQQKNFNSLLWWMKRLIALRKRFKAFGRGSIEFLDPKNTKILAFVRRYQEECILVVANFSRFIQYVELNLSNFKGMLPYELFGRTRFPIIGELPYLLTLGPYAFYWFSLQPEKIIDFSLNLISQTLPIFEISGHWHSIFQNSSFRFVLERYLLLFLKKNMWFLGKTQPFKKIIIEENIPIAFDSDQAFLTLVRIEYDKGNYDRYLIPIGFAKEGEDQFLNEYPQALIAKVHFKDSASPTNAILYDAFYHPNFMLSLLKNFFDERILKGDFGQLVNIPNQSKFKDWVEQRNHYEPVTIKYLSKSFIYVIFGDTWLLKIYRQLEQGINPEVEISEFLTNETSLNCVPTMLGSIAYYKANKDHFTLGMIQAYMPNQGSMWKYTLDEVDRYFERSATLSIEISKEDLLQPLLKHTHKVPSEEIFQLIGSYLEMARLMGQKTGELHLALSGNITNPAFIPQPSDIFYQRSLYQSNRSAASQAFQHLKRNLIDWPAPLKTLAQAVLNLENKVLKDFELFLHVRSPITRIRCHGNYQLNQLLFTGKDLIIVDSEGNIDAPFVERRRKRSPLIDVAGILRSFHFAVYTSLFQQKQKGVILNEQLVTYETKALFWQIWVYSAFLKAYLKTVDKAPFLPQDENELQGILNVYLLERAISDLSYELKEGHLDWLAISLQWILFIQNQPLIST